MANDINMQASNNNYQKQSFIAGAVDVHSDTIKGMWAHRLVSAGGRLMEAVLGLCG